MNICPCRHPPKSLESGERELWKIFLPRDSQAAQQMSCAFLQWPRLGRRNGSADGTSCDPWNKSNPGSKYSRTPPKFQPTQHCFSVVDQLLRYSVHTFEGGCGSPGKFSLYEQRARGLLLINEDWLFWRFLPRLEECRCWDRHVPCRRG